MRGTVNFAVDLGTTNSLIAKFDRGTVQVFKNPNGFKETLPSVVGFRNDRILVGDQARSYAERDAKNVASRFKRKMGTTETIKINALQTTKTPVNCPPTCSRSQAVRPEWRNSRSGRHHHPGVIRYGADQCHQRSRPSKRLQRSHFAARTYCSEPRLCQRE